uniref:Phlebovirus_G2 domain-containing protein n=1 Tax=Steinernema glaseri TaxID=37863 RepID=A0A1I7Z1R4_9BILA
MHNITGPPARTAGINDRHRAAEGHMHAERSVLHTSRLHQNGRRQTLSRPRMGSCVGETCALTKADTLVAELTAYNTLTGATRCEEACSCITCGCISCKGACLFYRLYVETIQTAAPIRIFKCHWAISTEVTVKLTTSSTDETFRLPLAPGETASKWNLTISLMKHQAMALQPQWFATDDRRTATLDEFEVSDAKLYACQDEGASRWMLNDRQIGCRQADDKIACDTSGNQLLMAAFEKSSLPQHVLGHVIESGDEGEITARLGSSSTTVQVTMKALRIVSRIDYSTCKANFETAVDCPSVKFSITFTPEGAPMTIRLALDKPIIDETCDVRCPSHASTARLEGSLFLPASSSNPWVHSRPSVMLHAPLDISEWIHRAVEALSGHSWLLAVLLFVTIVPCVLPGLLRCTLIL